MDLNILNWAVAVRIKLKICVDLDFPVLIVI